jgi:hypothetical protein
MSLWFVLHCCLCNVFCTVVCTITVIFVCTRGADPMGWPYTTTESRLPCVSMLTCLALLCHAVLCCVMLCRAGQRIRMQYRVRKTAAAGRADGPVATARAAGVAKGESRMEVTASSSQREQQQQLKQQQPQQLQQHLLQMSREQQLQQHVLGMSREQQQSRTCCGSRTGNYSRTCCGCLESSSPSSCSHSSACCRRLEQLRGGLGLQWLVHSLPCFVSLVLMRLHNMVP